jgi:hypothetical protein
MQLFFRRALFAPRKRKMEITVEVRQTLQLRRVRVKSRIFCAECASETLFLSSGEVADLLKSDDFSIEILPERERIHTFNSAENELLICFNSLKTELENFRFDELTKKI